MIRVTLDEQATTTTAQPSPAAGTDAWHTLDELVQAALLFVQRLRAQHHAKDTAAHAPRPAPAQQNATRPAESEQEKVPNDPSVREPPTERSADAGSPDLPGTAREARGGRDRPAAEGSSDRRGDGQDTADRRQSAGGTACR